MQGGCTYHVDSVLRDETREGAGTVLDVELGSVLHVGGRLGALVLVVEVEWLPVAAGWDPEVGGAGVEDHLRKAMEQ